MDLIDAEELTGKLLEIMPEVGENGVADEMYTVVITMPTIEAEPVRHGRWETTDWVEPDGHGFECIKTPNAGLRCSCCRNVFRAKLLWKNNYCPNCGAKMDGG